LEGSSNRVKQTFSLSEEILERLDDVWLELRKRKLKSVNKSAIVEFALENILKDVDRLAQRFST